MWKSWVAHAHQNTALSLYELQDGARKEILNYLLFIWPVPIMWWPTQSPGDKCRQPNSELSVEGETGSSVANSGHALLAQPVMAPISARDVNGLSTEPESMPGHSYKPNRNQPPASRKQLDTPNRLESIRNCLQKQGFPPDVVRLLLAATRKNSDAAYQSSWALWRDWCLRRDADPLSVGIAEILKFLSESFSEGKSYRTLNIQRSILSSTLNFAPSGLKDVGKHPLITRFFKGI